MKGLLAGTRTFITLLGIFACLSAGARRPVTHYPGREYVVLVSQTVKEDASWTQVIKALQEKHGAIVYTFSRLPSECLEDVKASRPRYVAIVEKPERLSRTYIRNIYQLSRQVDDDPFEDFLWGIITGKSAGAALRLVTDAATPLVVRTALSAVNELGNPAFLEQYAVIDPNSRESRLVSGQETDLLRTLPAEGHWTREDSLLAVYRELGKQLNEQLQQGITDTVLIARLQEIGRLVSGNSVYASYTAWKGKERKSDSLATHYTLFDSLGCTYMELFEKRKPDLILGASPDYNLFRLSPNLVQHMLSVKANRLYTDETYPRYMEPAGGRRVYLAAGGEGGAVYNVENNMVLTWLGRYGVSALAGYFSPSMHGQAAWGSWKMWMATPGRLTFPEAVFLNRQFITSRLQSWNPALAKIDFPPYEKLDQEVSPLTGRIVREAGLSSLSNEQFCYLHEREALVYYGDPKWNVRLQGGPEDWHFQVSTERKGRKCVIIIRTDAEFNRAQMAGNYFLEESGLSRPIPIGRLPFAYFFPERLKNPRIIKTVGIENELEVDENFLFIHRPAFEPEKTYQIVLLVD